MAGPFGEAGNEYWDKRINTALSGLKNRPVAPANRGGATSSAPIDFNKIDFSKFGQDAPEPVEPEKNALQKVVEAPVIKQVLDAVSVFNYAGANIANNMVDSAEQGKGPGDYIGDVFEGIGQGVTGAFGGNEENARGYGEVIRRVQENAGVDVDSTGAKLVSGIGGFAGDVLLDPTTYIGVGAIKGVAGGVKGVAAFGQAKKINRVLDSLKESSEVTDVVRKTVPGKYSPAISAEISEIRKFRGDANIELPFSTAPLNFDAIRPSRKASKIEAVELDFKNKGLPVREAATGRVDAFKAGFQESMKKFRLEERSRKVNKIENRDARRKMRENPDEAIATFIRAPMEELSSVAHTIAPSAGIRMVEDIIRNSDDMLAIERPADEVTAIAADVFETIKADAYDGDTVTKALEFFAADRMTPNAMPEGFTPEPKVHSRTEVRKIVVARQMANMRKAAERREASRQGIDPETIPSDSAGDIVESGTVAVRGESDEAIIRTDTEKPGAVTPQEIQRSAEEITDMADELASNPVTHLQMRVRAVKEQQAVDTAFVLAKAVLPKGTLASGSSEFFYPRSVIEAAKKLTAVKPDAGVIMARYREIVGVVPVSRLQSMTAALKSGDTKRIQQMLNTDPNLRAAFTKAKEGASDQLYINLGIAPGDVKFARSAELRATDILDYEKNMATVVKHLRNLESEVNASKKYRMNEEHPLWETVHELEEIFGVVGPRAVAKALNDIDKKSPLWQEAMKFASGARAPKSAMRGITETVGEDYIKASLKLVPTEETTQVIARQVERSKAAIDELRPGHSAVIDKLMADAVRYQRTPGGSRRTSNKRATTDGDDLGAKINYDWNTNASMKLYGDIQRDIYGLYKKGEFQDFAARDALTMSSLRYAEATLWANGIDFHLTNMAQPYNITRTLKNGDRVTQSTGQYSVRLGLSDIYGAMTPNLRAQYALGGKMVLLPSQFTDMGEAMVRAARELDPLTGGVNIERAKLLTKLAVMGEQGNVRIMFPNNTTRLAEPDDDWSELIQSGARIMTREMGKNLDNSSRINILTIAVNRYLKGTDGKNLLKREEIKEIFAPREVLINGVRKMRQDPDEIIKDLSIRLGGEIDGDSILNNAIDQVRSTIYDDLIESFFTVGTDGRMPFNKLVESAISNSMMLGKSILDRATAVGEADFERVLRALETNSSSGLIEAVATGSKAVKELPIEAQKLIADTNAEQLAKVLPPETTKHLKAQAKVANSVNEDNANALRTELITATPVAKLVDDSQSATTTAERVEIEAELFNASVNEVSLGVANAMNRGFNPVMGFPISADIVTQSTHTVSVLLDVNTRQFSKWEKAGIKGPQIKTALNAIRAAVRNGVDPKTLTGTDAEVFNYFNVIFDTSQYNFFKANGIEGAAMKRFKFNMQKSFNTQQVKDYLPKDATAEQLSTMWTELPIEDPYSFVSKLYYVYAKTLQETAVASHFSKTFGQAVTPQRAKELGLVKIVDPDNKNIFARMIDSNLYYTKEMANEVTYINRMINADRSFEGPMQNFIENIFDPVVSVIKMGQTSVKPGHHVMSVVGDWWRNYMVTGSTMMREYKQAAHLVGAIRKARKNEAPIDAMTRKLDGFMDYEFKNFSNSANNEEFLTLMLPKRGGKGKVATKVPIQELITLGEKHGVFFAPHSGGVSEDLLSGASSGIKASGIARGVKTGTDKLLDNKLTGAINAFSADRDGLSRGALFLFHLQNRKFSSLDDAAIYAGAQVRKAAPVAADLAAWESKWARRGVFYYTWLRGITPRILETLMTRPGLAMIPSKGMYELADANGLDPNSFGDPMSEEVKSNLPDYYQERVMGPAYQDAESGDYWGFSSVSPTIDVLNTFGSNIAIRDLVPNPYSIEDPAYAKMGKTLIGMTTPWVKYPAELSTGFRMDTGAPIESRIQYMQDQNAIARTISKVTGKNIDLLNRTETRYRDGMENPEEMIGTELINFAASPQLMNYSADNVVKGAEFQEKQEQTDLKKLLQRMGQSPEQE